MKDPKEYFGRFEIKDIDENTVVLKLIIGEKKDADK